jgi:molybdopterin-binding protein
VSAMVVNQADGRVTDLLDGAVVTDVTIEVAP